MNAMHKEQTRNSMRKGGKMVNSTYWKPKEIIVNNSVKHDPVTINIIKKCPNVPVKYVSDGRSNTIVNASVILRNTTSGMLDTILAGKRVLYIAPASTSSVDLFTMPDNRILCPHFNRIKWASSCPFSCDWCYLKLTYRANRPFITVYVQHQKIKKQIKKRLQGASSPVSFNSGELADSLALEHLIGSAKYFITWFGKQDMGYLFMLTKSTNVNGILNLPHNGRTIIAWSINNDRVSRRFEIGAPSFRQRVRAARKVQDAGYRLRLRLDPIVPFNGWKQGYSETIKDIFKTLNPERITLGTLRFEKGFVGMRDSIFNSGDLLPQIVSGMKPMFPPINVQGKKNPSVGKFSFSENVRTIIFNFVIQEIRKHSDCSIALCKESRAVWANVGLNSSQCDCVCQA
jgi:spore photoproduct lyase